ncbi:Elongation factor 1-alpha 1 [Myotis brandtii]|uniref:Elongation factor 1-alpha 1 n=1 Tax=Myotis brandtii TaxID=109478 RepID=S7MNL8_MYOBR|nr:Elongation factor 1-alpha 1 [Myotis brandtii]
MLEPSAITLVQGWKVAHKDSSASGTCCLKLCVPPATNSSNRQAPSSPPPPPPQDAYRMGGAGAVPVG